MLQEESYIQNASVSLQEETLTIETADSVDTEKLREHLVGVLEKHDYGIHAEKPEKTTRKNEWLYAIIATSIFVTGFILLEKAGITSLIGTSEGTLMTALLVGAVASVSTCLAVVGGLVLSVSATYAHEGRGWKPQASFHAGRLIGFFILGGLLGVLGEIMQIGFYGSAILGGIASIVMVILGIHLLDVTKKVRVFTLPKAVSTFFTDIVNRFGVFTPILLGAVTFFLPCGFTQSMQIVALSSGSAVTGALTMLTFALGTLPVLALLSFGSLDLAKSKYRGTFFKTAGLIVILFGLFNIHNVFVVFGFITPIIQF